MLAEQDWTQVTKDLGFPIAIALLLLLTLLGALGTFFTGIGLFMYRTGIWLAPIVEKVATKHIDLMGTLEESTIKRDQVDARTVNALEAMNASQSHLDDIKERTTTAIEAMCKTQSEMCSTQQAIQSEVSQQRKLQEHQLSLQEQLNAKVDSKVAVAIQMNGADLIDEQELASVLNMTVEEVQSALRRLRRRPPTNVVESNK